jgi:uncharacterized membrane protein YagU involved in acid resistance
MSDLLIRRCVNAGLAGFAATVPMTAYMEWADDARITAPASTLPPRQIVEEAAGETVSVATEAELQFGTRVAHYGYGTAVATIYGLHQVRGTVCSEMISGVAFGLQIWALSYLGLLPALGSRARAAKQSRRTNAVVIAAHLIWGASLGLSYFVLQQRRRMCEREMADRHG